MHPTPVELATNAASSARSLRPPAAPRSGARPARICVVGALTGSVAGRSVTQGEIVAARLAEAGHPVLTVSHRAGRYARLADITATLLRRGRDVDVMLLQVYGGPSFVVEDLASAIGARAGHRIVAALHGGAMPEFMARYPRWTRRVLSRADALVAPSGYLAAALERHGFHVHVVPNTLDPDAFHFRLRERATPRLFWMRSFHPLYNPRLAVRVLARVARTAPGATLVMAGGDLGEEAVARAEAERLGVAGAVRFAGFLDAAAKRRETDAADIFLNTNLVDNTPVGVLEACAAGLPVVATAVGGVPYMLRDGETGLLVPDDDDEAMASAVLRLLDSPALVHRLSAGGRRLAESCAWPVVHEAWERIIAGVAPPARGAPYGREVA